MLWSDDSKFEIFGSTCRVFVRHRKSKRMVSTYMVPTVTHGGRGVMVWGCFAGDTVGDLFKIEGTLNQHGYHSILQRHAIPSGLHLVGPSLIFQQDSDPKHTPGCVRAIWPRRRVMESTVTWPKPSPDGLGWDGTQSESKRSTKHSASLGTPSRLLENHFRWRPHEAHRENVKSVQSSNQRKGWLFWRI